MRSTQKQKAYTLCNETQLVRGGQPYFDRLLAMIAAARQRIHLQVYIFEPDQTGTRVAEALALAARRGVRVFVLADAYASAALFRSPLLRLLQESWVFIRGFEPLLRSRHFYFGRRLHHKIFVIDGSEAMVGGINIADRYNEVDGIPAWLDFALWVKGEIAPQLEARCRELYDNQRYKPRVAPFAYPASPQTQRSVRMRINDWVRRKNQVWRTYFHILNQSQHQVTIMCSYFLPGYVLRRQMKKAVRRGVRVRLILAGQSDIPLTKHAERYLYPWFLRHRILVYEYEPSVLHAKLAVADGRRLTIGSFNVNNISTYASIECNLDVRNRAFVQEVEQALDAIVETDCRRISAAQLRLRNSWWTRLVQTSAYHLFKLLLFLFTFYFRQEE